MELTRDNYYTKEADMEYMSCSQYQDFLRCEAATMARLHGMYIPKETEALTVGNYFHTALESDEAHQKFCEEHEAEIYKMQTSKRTGEVSIVGKYAPYQKADEMLRVFMADPIIKQLILMPGENEVIMTGNIFGVPWRIRMDKYIPEKRMIIDWKTSADLNKTEYNPETGERESFIEFLGYMMRAAVYTEIEKQNANSETDAKFVIAAVSKQDPPDKGAYLLNHRQRYDYELEQIKNNLSRIIQVKTGRVKPRRCGCCEYCRSTKRLKKIVPYYLLKPGFKEEREEEYDDIFFELGNEAEDMEASRTESV